MEKKLEKEKNIIPILMIFYVILAFYVWEEIKIIKID